MAIQYVHTTTIRSSMLGRDKDIVATAAGTIQDIQGPRTRLPDLP